MLSPTLLRLLSLPQSLSLTNSSPGNKVRDEWLKFWIVACLWEREVEWLFLNASCLGVMMTFAFCTLSFWHHSHKNFYYFQASENKSSIGSFKIPGKSFWQNLFPKIGIIWEKRCYIIHIDLWAAMSLELSLKWDVCCLDLWLDCQLDY